jgi:hypothetical protein
MKHELSQKWIELNEALNQFKKSLLEALWIIRFLNYIHSDEFKFFWRVQVRRSIMHFFAYKVCKMKEWEKPTRTIRVLKWILYPFHMFYENWNWMSYSPITDQYEVEWMLIDAQFFRDYKENNNTHFFKLIKQDERTYIKNLNWDELLNEIMPNPIVKYMREEHTKNELLNWNWQYEDKNQE